MSMTALPGVALWALVSEAMVRHEKQHSCRCGDAGQRAGEHADHRTDIDEWAEEGNSHLGGEKAHRCRAVAKTLRRGVEAEDLGVCGDEEEATGEHGALDEGTRDGAKGVARLGA